MQSDRQLCLEQLFMLAIFFSASVFFMHLVTCSMNLYFDAIISCVRRFVMISRACAEIVVNCRSLHLVCFSCGIHVSRTLHVLLWAQLVLCPVHNLEVLELILLGILLYAFGLLVQIGPPDQFSINNFGLCIKYKQHVVRINRELLDTFACKSLEFNIPDFRGELITSFFRMGFKYAPCLWT